VLAVYLFEPFDRLIGHPKPQAFLDPSRKGIGRLPVKDYGRRATQSQPCINPTSQVPAAGRKLPTIGYGKFRAGTTAALRLATVVAPSIRRVYNSGVSVPIALLGLLEREPGHGYELKRDYDTFFGRGKPLPFGQVYATLARLARDGKMAPGEVEPGAGPERKRYAITEMGRTEV
jgi:hypothetical protein